MSADAQTIPEDIMKTANMLGADIRHHIAVSSRELIEHDPILDAMIVKALHGERKRCASVARDATMMTGAPVDEIGDEVAAAVLSQPKASKFWMVYGIGQRGSTYQHRSKASAQEEANRLASLQPGIPFVVLAAVDAYCANAPVMQRIKIIKLDPVDVSRDRDDDIPF
ncbi:hypothetical protein JVX98_13020 [Ensifer sp. PDNC004]|uniref:hypothetical protein n=1 Tax=Ensifer sp. PDNC004 TaxID=2811423 RepID=UPI001962EA82|nr:hypothetical protein [Ensifer sp. PDNC004]QRY69139.1 hypothetical protein JVX98_13020 [Ensifer sp. PDNC004]